MRVLEKKRQEREEVREKGRFEVHLGEMRRGEGTGEEGDRERRTDERTERDGRYTARGRESGTREREREREKAG